MNTKELQELDAQIAEQVFGLKHSEGTERIGRGEFYRARGSGDVIVYFADGRDYGGPMDFSPTTDPSAAMEVLKKVCEKLSTGSVEIYQGCDESPEYRRVWCLSARGMAEISMAPTLELAIALFAKKLFT